MKQLTGHFTTTADMNHDERKQDHVVGDNH